MNKKLINHKSKKTSKVALIVVPDLEKHIYIGLDAAKIEKLIKLIEKEAKKVEEELKEFEKSWLDKLWNIFIRISHLIKKQFKFIKND